MTEIAVDMEDLYDKLEDMTTQTVIQNRYAFWFHRRGGKVQAANLGNYEESMKLLASFQTVEHFWRIYDHMIRPNDFKTTTDYHLFKDGVKPTWEDPQNKNGGKWMVRLKKGLASRLWEEVVLAIIGEQFDVGHEICGAVCSVRNNEDIISVWNKTADNEEATSKIRDQLRRFLKLPTYIPLEYKKHQDSLADKSSFRNPTAVWRAPSRVEGNKDGKQPYYNKDRQSSGGYHQQGGQRGDSGGGGGGGGGGSSYNRERSDGDSTPHGGGGLRTGWKPRDLSGGASSGDGAQSVQRGGQGGQGSGPPGWAKREGSAPGAGDGGISPWATKRELSGGSGWSKNPREGSGEVAGSAPGVGVGGPVRSPRQHSDGSTPSGHPGGHATWSKRDSSGGEGREGSGSGNPGPGTGGSSSWAKRESSGGGTGTSAWSKRESSGGGSGGSAPAGSASGASSKVAAESGAAAKDPSSSSSDNVWSRRRPPTIDTEQ